MLELYPANSWALSIERDWSSRDLKNMGQGLFVSGVVDGVVLLQ